MIPVYQTLTVANDGRGNCFNACVASILELPLRDVAQVSPDFEGDYWGEWRNWAKGRGLEINWHRLHEGAPKGFAIGTVKGGRTYPLGHPKAGQDILHAVVVFNGFAVHDPFPGGGDNSEPVHFWTIDPISLDEAA